MSNTEIQGTDGDEKSYRGEKQTRLSAVWTALAIAIVALAAILVFILQNQRSVEVSFLAFHGRLPLAVALLFAMMLGAVIVLASGAARILQLRAVARRARRAQANASPPPQKVSGPATP
jgi:putative membrane protein